MVALLNIVVTVVIFALSGAHKILVVFPFPSKSHSILGHSVVRHLLEAGNEVIYITSFPMKNPSENLTQVDVSSIVNPTQLDGLLNLTEVFKGEVPVNNYFVIIKFMREVALSITQHENVQKLIYDPNQHFDAVLVEWMLSDIHSGFAQLYSCPYIVYTSFDMSVVILEKFDELQNPAYTPSMQITHLPPFTFVGRVKELFVQIGIYILDKWVLANQAANDYNQIFLPVLQKFGKPIHSFDDVRNNVSLVLANSHVSMGYAQKLPLNYLSIGGYHIDTDIKPLSKDLQEIMDNAKNGVIYFSMGSNLKSKSLPDKVKTSLVKMFGTLKQTVLWKFEENLPDLPDNVKILQWAPQQSILAHPNCILFITHGGLLSTTETIHFGVPIIGIPVFGDQFVNVEQAVTKGYAKRVDLSYEVADKLKIAIQEMLSNPIYKKKVKELSFIYHHRPIHPGKLLAHGVEHVILTKGAPHLRSPASMTPWYQKLYLDLAAIVLAILLTLKIVLKKIFIRMTKKESKKSGKKNN